MSIKKYITAVSIALIGLLMVAITIATFDIHRIRMGGPLHYRSVQAADLIADILPPPEYIIEPYLEATLLMQSPGQYEQRAARLAELKRDFDTRERYWADSDLAPELRAAKLRDTDPPAERFWRDLDQHFLPAIRAGDMARARASYAELQRDYAIHRKGIDALVQNATAYQTRIHDQAESTLRWSMLLLGALGLAILGGIAGFCVMLLRRVIEPLAQVSDATAALAEGDAQDVPHCARGDELGAIARAVDKFRLAAAARAQADARTVAEQEGVTSALAESLAALREGDLTKFIRAEFPPAFGVLKTNYNEAVGALRGMVQLVTESACDIQVSASEISRASDDLARRTESNAASLEQTTAALTQIDDRIKENARSAGETVGRAGQALGNVTTGRENATAAVAAMDRVQASATNIDSVIEGMNKIAFQTRVLSMNATVEAGRAGDAGRGFAVVADLVSVLAGRAEEEATRARELLNATQGDVADAIGAVGTMDTSFTMISEDVEQVHHLLDALRADQEAQSIAVSEAATALRSMDVSTQQNAAMVEETSAATRNLSQEVTALAARAATFKFDRRERDVPVANDRRRNRRATAPTPVPAPEREEGQWVH